MPIRSCIDLKCPSSVTVKRLFDNTCKCSIIFTIHSLEMRLCSFEPPFKNAGSPSEYVTNKHLLLIENLPRSTYRPTVETYEKYLWRHRVLLLSRFDCGYGFVNMTRSILNGPLLFQWWVMFQTIKIDVRD